MWERLGGDDLRRAHRAQRGDEQEADRPAAIDAGTHARSEVTQLDGVDGDAQGLEQWDLGVGDRVGDRLKQASWPGHQFPKRTVGGAVTREAQSGTEIGVPGDARGAALTRDGWVDRDPLTGGRARRDHTADLVPEDEGARQPRVTDAAIFVPVQIGATQTHPRDANELLPRARHGVRFVVDLEHAGGMQTQHLHLIMSGRWARLPASFFLSDVLTTPAAPGPQRGWGRKPGCHGSAP